MFDVRFALWWVQRKIYDGADNVNMFILFSFRSGAWSNHGALWSVVMVVSASLILHSALQTGIVTNNINVRCCLVHHTCIRVLDYLCTILSLLYLSLERESTRYHLTADGITLKRKVGIQKITKFPWLVPLCLYIFMVYLQCWCKWHKMSRKISKVQHDVEIYKMILLYYQQLLRFFVPRGESIIYVLLFNFIALNHLPLLKKSCLSIH